MIVLRPTLDLAKRFNITLSKEELQLKDTFAEWYGNAILVNGRQYILIVNTKTRLGVVLDSHPYPNFLTKLPAAIYQTLTAIGISRDLATKVCSEMHEVRLRHAVERSLMSTLTEYKVMLNNFALYLILRTPPFKCRFT